MFHDNLAISLLVGSE